MKYQDLYTTNGNTLDVRFINSTTKQAQQIIRMYKNTTRGEDIYDAYNSPSGTKVSAFKEIKKEMEQVKGYSMRITGAGSDFFSCAYRVKDGSGFEYLIYHTHLNRFAVLYKKPEWAEANAM